MDAYATVDTAAVHRCRDSLAKIKVSARKLFIERGYHTTRPQDIARDAGLGHGTFYLHYKDKRECFFAFVEDARTEFLVFMRERVIPCTSIESTIAQTLEAICAFSDQNPRLLNAVTVDEALFDTDMRRGPSAVQLWTTEWAGMIRKEMHDRNIAAACDPEIAGLAVIGAMYQCLQEGDRMGIPREQVTANLTQLLMRALTDKSA
jgi:AcrR family transcriptional regulator